MFISGRKAGKAYAEKNFYTLKQIPYMKSHESCDGMKTNRRYHELGVM